ncbi:PREDICTED: protein ACCELERATED CELL DEATH 6 [Camelina sativa]|uniref:Protein ACCELERATED CELL DEATH 6 n=1 Tax=Camelina sativa TaxID=90675 RepID=A0ABM0T8A3_CAMSA|nr:PREDICTED: protein ACCELERATED CELL DEATH 6 [Camelina sativa]
MDSSEASLDGIEAQRLMNVSHDQREGRCFPMNLINKVVNKLCSRGDSTTPPRGGVVSEQEFLENLKFSNLFDLPGENVLMNSEIYSGVCDGNKECLEKLRSHGTPMACLKSDRGDSILHLAARRGHLELVKNIISEFPCLLLEPNYDDQLPLHVAAHVGHPAQVKAIIVAVTFYSDRLAEEARERLNPYVLKDKYGYTPLHLAIEGQHISTAGYLINADYGAIFLENNEGISSLYMAVEAGKVLLVKSILGSTDNDDLEWRKSYLNSKLEGRKYLAHVALEARNTDVLNVILHEYPFLEDERDKEGRTCLSFGASIGFYEGVCNLLGRSTKGVYVCDKDGSFPIHTAAEKGHIKIVQEILKRCPNSKYLLNKLGQNLLHIAAKVGDYKLVKSLMRSDDTKYMGAEQDVDGNTPLHLATLNWRYQSAKTLAFHTELLKLRNNNGLTARGVAESEMKSNYIFHERLTLAYILCASVDVEPVKSITKPSKPLDHEKSRDYINTLLLVASLVATMTFAAGFTIPGGLNSSGPYLGRATMTNHRSLFFFLLFDTLALVCSVATIYILIWAQLGDPSLVPSSLNMALPLLLFALMCMPFAFIAGIMTVISHVPWMSYIISLIAFFFLHWAMSILGPQVLLQQTNVHWLYGVWLDLFMDYQWLVSGRYGQISPPVSDLTRPKNIKILRL